MMRSLLVRGMLTGLAAAALALVFAWIFGEPQVGHAIAFEDAHDKMAGMAPGPEIVSRSVQQTWGLATGIGFVGVALGGLFAIAFAIAYGRIGNFSARATSALVAAGGFLAVEVVPFLKYPANPPSIGNPDTIGRRTVLYFAMIAIGIVITIAAVQTGRRLAPRYGNWNATLLAAAAFIVLLTIAYLVLPAVNEVPASFPATVLWRFRLASLGIQAVLWTTLGLGFGTLTERSLASAPTPQNRSPPPSKPTATKARALSSSTREGKGSAVFGHTVHQAAKINYPRPPRAGWTIMPSTRENPSVCGWCHEPYEQALSGLLGLPPWY